MSINVPKNRHEFMYQLYDPLVKNFFYIMLTSVFTSGVGFIFWILGAKLYSTEDVGIATAMISSMSLLILLSRLGLDSSIIRYIPEGDKSRIFNTYATITTFFSIFIGTIFILTVDTFSPELQILKVPLNAIIYLFFVAINSLATFAGVFFIAIRKAKAQLFQSIILSSKIIFLVLFVSVGSLGIFSAFGISFVFSLIISVIIFARLGIKLGLVLDYKILKESYSFSIENYIVNLLTLAPSQVLPIITLTILGKEATAYYYIAYSIASLLFMIPNSVSISLFVEGSHGEEIKKTVIKSLIATMLVLIPSIIFLYFYSGWLLSIIGKDYSENGMQLLQSMIFASVFMTATSIYSSVKRIQKDIKRVKLLSAIQGALLIGFGYIFMPIFGIIGMGYAWIASYSISGIVVLGMIRQEKWF